MTKHPIKLNNQLNTKTIYTDTNTNQEESVISPSSSPSPPSSGPHSPGEITAVPSSPPSPSELPEIMLLCQRLKPSIEELNKKNLTSAEFMTILVRELTPVMNKNLGPKKTTKKKRDRGSTRKCSICGTISTPEWRRDPEGLLTLCNACGLKEKKNRARISTAAASPAYTTQRFHNTVWNQQQYSNPSVNGGLPRHQHIPPIHHVPSTTSVPAQMATPHILQQSVQHHGNIPPIYHSFPVKPAPHMFKLEDNGVQFNQRYLQTQMVHQANNLPTPYNHTYQIPVHLSEESFGYPQATQNNYSGSCERQNCTQCQPSFYHPY